MQRHVCTALFKHASLIIVSGGTVLYFCTAFSPCVYDATASIPFQVESLDEDHLLVKAAVTQNIIREVELNVRVVTAKEFKDSSRVINKDMYDKFKVSFMCEIFNEVLSHLNLFVMTSQGSYCDQYFLIICPSGCSVYQSIKVYRYL